jgi:putative ABC transport system permease protein
MKRFLLELRENTALALSSLAAHKLRSGLTLLGVLVGVFSIILVMTAMRAMQNNIENQLGSMGSKTFAIQKMPGAFFGGGGHDSMVKFFRRREIDYPQARRFQREADFAPFVGLHANFWTREVSSLHARTPPNVSIEGATPGLFQTNNWSVIEGRALLDSDLESARDICLLNDVVARTLFPKGSPIGQRIRLSSIPYTVVGVFERPSSGEGAAGGLVILPLTTGLNRYGRWAEISILVRVEDPAHFEDTLEQARGLFRMIRKVPPADDDDFEVLTSAAMIEQFEKVTRTVRLGLTLVSSIALLAAGVGIMNIMLVSVTERTREIGIRRALGARRRSIMTQFLMEAIVLCELGGILGIALGLGGAYLLATHLLKLPPAYPLDWTIIALVICSLVGLIFGSYPAWKAAHLDPIEALRHE